MRTTTCSLLAIGLFFLGFSFTSFGQNLAISTQNPDGLYVCGADQMSVTIQNSAGSPTATTLRLSVVFPNGVTYEPGTVSGATEFNITNLNAPVFSLNDLAGGGNATVTFNVGGGCALVNAINSGQQFSNNITATFTGGSKQLTSNNYIIETGLANLVSVNPATTTGMKGDVITRIITLKNTRLGPIEGLSFRDQHQGGITVDLQGGINQVNAPTLFTADIPGSYFTAFGDGDNLLENTDGEVTIVEKITIDNCGIPSFTTKSDIIVGWGCGSTTCRSDSIEAQITILPSNENPNLFFIPTYTRPLSDCGEVPSVQEILIINAGQLPAENVKVDIFTLDTSYMAFNSNSFQWSDNGSTWTTAQILTTVPTVLGSCNISDYMLEVKAMVPIVQPGDTVRLRFDSYFCQPVCEGLFPRMRFGFSYNKACPANIATNGLQNYYPDTAFLKVASKINFNIGHCLESGSSYDLLYWIKSKRLLVDTGVLQVLLQLPKGLEWDPSCSFSLDGQTPLEFTTDVGPDGTTHVRAVFDLPFSQDSVADDFCIKYNCQLGMPCQSNVGNVPPDGIDYVVYPPPSDCKGCELEIKAQSVISLTADVTPECGISACDEFTMVVDDECNDTGGGGGIGGGGLAVEYTVGFNSWRVNRGLQDDNDDRTADNANTANNPGMRLDRFLTGDTLRNQLQLAIISGVLQGVNYRLFLESLTSDFGASDGDGFFIAEAKRWFTNNDTTDFVGARFIVKKANGQTYSCPVNAPSIRSDKHLIEVAEPNIRPPVIVDKLANMFDQYNLTVDTYINNGCLPGGFEIGAGDSLFIQMDYKFTNNFIPLGGPAPSLVNFRTSVCDVYKTYSWELENFCTQKPMRQFSGFTEIVTPAAQRIEPCALSTELSPFKYNLRVARQNLFPFEVRPLTSIFGYSYSLPTNVTLLNTQLQYLRLQESVPVFVNQGLTPSYAGDSIQLDLGQFFANPMDEGYSFSISTRFDTTCGYNGSKFGRTSLSVHYASECLHDPQSVHYYFANPNGYINGSPELDFFNIGSNVVYLPTENAELNFTIRNNSPVTAYNAWLIIESDNNLADVELYQIDPPNLIPVPAVGGVYQLDSLVGFGQPFFRLKAKSKSCGNFEVKYRFGWGCSPTYNDQENTCGEFTGTVEVRPQPPELELTIIQEQTNIPLCTPSGDFSFEISNANDGSAYNVVPTVKLPPGIKIVPNSSRLSFPAGVGVPITMSDPVQLPGNVWQFDPEAASPLLAQNGLVTFEQEPLNTMRIYFKVQADCGSVANAQPVYGAEAVQPCGISSNKLRKPGEPIGINGVNSANTAVCNLNFTNPNASTSCGETVELEASILLDGTPSAGDSIYILLPQGTSYVTNSYAPGANAPSGTGLPTISGQQLQLPLPTTLGANVVLNFKFKVRYDNPAGCTDKFITLQTREKTQAICGSTQCDVYVSTGEALLNLNAQNPELQFNNFQMHTQANGQVTFTANLENEGEASAVNPTIKIYHDLNGNNQVDPGEPEVGSVNPTVTITPGASAGISGNINIAASAFCDLIAVIPALENCACSDAVFPLAGNQVITTGIGLCSPQPVQVGTTPVAGNTYTWQTPAGLSCTDCAQATYTPGPDVHAGDLVTLILLEKVGDCTLEHRFDIQFGGDFGIESSTQTICAGESATLEATAGGASYQWSGPGIVNPNQQTQVVTPVGNTVYSVTVTFAGGCIGTGTATVLVLPQMSSSMVKTTCSGMPIEVFPNLITDVPGDYTQTTTGANGCDNITTVHLLVSGGMKESTVTICQGDSTNVFGQFIKTPQTLCKDYTTPGGCDSTSCVTVKVVPNPDVPVQDSVILQKGGSILLNGPSGFAQYQWAPPEGLQCPTCEDVEVHPDTNTTYILVVKDDNHCLDSVQYRVFICDVDAYLDKIPNAFTPNGDGANDVFRGLPLEGAEMVSLLQIYDRWGTKIYEGRGTNAYWDGKIKGVPAPSDVYVYIIQAGCSGITKKKTGEVTLLR